MDLMNIWRPGGESRQPHTPHNAVAEYPIYLPLMLSPGYGLLARPLRRRGRLGRLVFIAVSRLAPPFEMTPRHLGPRFALLMQRVQLFVREVFERGKPILRPLHRENELGELDLYGEDIAVLRVLNREHHQKRHNGRAGIDDQLPRIAVIEIGPHRAPDQDDEHGEQEH